MLCPLQDEASSLTADNLEELGKLSASAGPAEDGMLLSEAKLQSVLNFLHELDLEESGPGRPASAPQVWWVPSVGHRLWAGEWACLMCAVSSGAGAGGAARAPGAQVRGEPLRDAAAAGGGEAAGGRAAAESPGDAPTLPSDPRVPQGALSLVTGCSGLSLRGLIRPSLQAQWRDLTVRQARETEEELGRQQREHYEATIQRHLCFIDQVTLPGKRGARAGVSGPAGPMGQGEGQDRVPDRPGPLGAF